MSKSYINHTKFNKNELKFGEPSKDKYGNIKCSAVYGQNKYPIIRVVKPCHTFGIQEIPLFQDKSKPSGKYQMALSPYKNGRTPDKDIKGEIELERLMEGIKERVLDHIVKDKHIYGLGKMNREMLKHSLDPIMWRKTDKKGEVIDNDEEGRTYLYIKLISFNSNGEPSPKNIKTFFDDGKNPLEPEELVGVMGKVYPDLKLRGFMFRQGKFKVQLELSEATFIRYEKERIGDREIDDLDLDSEEF